VIGWLRGMSSESVTTRDGLEGRSAYVPARAPGFGNLTGPIRVNEGTTLGVPAAWRCAQILSETIGTLPLHNHRDGHKTDDQPTFIQQPEPDRTRVETISALVLCLVMHGNAYLVVTERDRLGYPLRAVLVDPQRVMPVQTSEGIAYRLAGSPALLDSSEVLHFRNMALPGSLTGLGVLGMHARTIGANIAGEDYAMQTWVTGGVPDGILTTDQMLSSPEADEFKARWNESQGGRQRTPPVLSGGMKYQSIGFSAVELQMIESRQYDGGQICTIFGVPAFLAGVPATDSVTYQTVSQDITLFVLFTLQPLVSRIEAVFTNARPRGQSVKFNMDALLRADTTERYANHAVGIASGFLEVNEAREWEDLPPITEPEPDPEPDDDDQEDDDDE
jgi:HK97 family phage portal protein